MFKSSLEVAVNVACHLGEGPIFHSDHRALYWTDIEGKRIHRLDVDSGEHTVAAEPGKRVGGVTIQADGALVLFGDDARVTIFQDGELHPVLPGISKERGTRFNDVFADPVGRVFAGTMPKEGQLGTLYRIDPDLSVHTILEGIGCSNGMGLSPDGKALYYIDTSPRKLYRFDYDSLSGRITNQTVLREFTEEEKWPDGMTVDGLGNIWVAFWGGYCVRCLSPEGEILHKLDVPVEAVTAPTILPDGTMYLTTAGGATRKGDSDLAGSLFRVQLDVPGVLEHRSRIGGGLEA